jgi:hypothetical protein
LGVQLCSPQIIAAVALVDLGMNVIWFDCPVIGCFDLSTISTRQTDTLSIDHECARQGTIRLASICIRFLDGSPQTRQLVRV